MSEEVKLSALLTLAMVLVSLGVDYIKAGMLIEGTVLVLLGLLVIVIYFLVVLPSYMQRRFNAEARRHG
ncbi:MAG: hypothetical protein QW390_04260 [Candidatus Bathyarchaeia archaeon]